MFIKQLNLHLPAECIEISTFEYVLLKAFDFHMNNSDVLDIKTSCAVLKVKVNKITLYAGYAFETVKYEI